jgi:hypothetical protein
VAPERETDELPVMLARGICSRGHTIDSTDDMIERGGEWRCRRCNIDARDERAGMRTQ